MRDDRLLVLVRIEYEDGDAEDLDLEELLSLPLAQLEELRDLTQIPAHFSHALLHFFLTAP
eukprot:3832361-Pleurochrysis_carterae.AAC.1